MLYHLLQAAIQLRVIDLYVKGQEGIAPKLYGTRDIKGWVRLLDETTDQLFSHHNQIYLGFDTPRRLENIGAIAQLLVSSHVKTRIRAARYATQVVCPNRYACTLLAMYVYCFVAGEFRLRDIWEEPLHTVKKLVDTSSPYVVEERMSLWDAGNEFIIAVHDTLNNYGRCDRDGPRSSRLYACLKQAFGAVVPLCRACGLRCWQVAMGHESAMIALMSLLLQVISLIQRD